MNLKRVAKWGLGLAVLLSLPFFAAIAFWFYVVSTLPPIESLVNANDTNCLENPQVPRVKIRDLPEYVKMTFVVAEAPKFFNQRALPTIRILDYFLEGLFGYNYRFDDLRSFSDQISQNNINALNKERYDLFSHFQKLVQSDRIELSFGKLEILEVYFNQTYFAKGTIGLACASQHFFHKAPEALSISETALLAALARNPTNFDPVKFPLPAEKRRNLIIDQVLEAGFITSADADAAKATPLLPE